MSSPSARAASKYFPQLFPSRQGGLDLGPNPCDPSGTGCRLNVGQCSQVDQIRFCFSPVLQIGIRSHCRIGPLLCREWQRDFRTVIWKKFVVGRLGDADARLSPVRNRAEAARYNRKSTTKSDNPLCSTTGFGLSSDGFRCPHRFQIVAACCRPP